MKGKDACCVKATLMSKDTRDSKLPCRVPKVQAIVRDAD